MGKLTQVIKELTDSDILGRFQVPKTKAVTKAAPTRLDKFREEEIRIKAQLKVLDNEQAKVSGRAAQGKFEKAQIAKFQQDQASFLTNVGKQDTVRADMDRLRKALIATQAKVATVKAQKVVDSTAGVQAKAMAKQGAEEKAFARDFVRGKSDIAAEQTRARAKAIDSQNAAARLEAQQLAEASANGGSILDQIGKSVDAARVKSGASASYTPSVGSRASQKAKGILNSDITKGQVKAAAGVAAGGAIIGGVFNSALEESGLSSLTSAKHISVGVDKGQLVDSTGRPVSDAELTTASEAGQVTYGQEASSVSAPADNARIAEPTRVMPNGSEINIDGRVIDRQRIQAETGVTIVTRAEAIAQGIDAPGTSDLIFLSGVEGAANFNQPSVQGSGLNSKLNATTTLETPISELTGRIASQQNELRAEAESRATEIISNDPVIQAALPEYDTMSDSDKAIFDRSLKAYKTQETDKALIEMSREPVYAQKSVDLATDQQLQARLVKAKAEMGTMPEELRLFKIMHKNIPDVRALALYNKSKVDQQVIADYQISGKLPDVSKVINQDMVKAIAALGVAESSGDQTMNKDIANLIVQTSKEAFDFTGLELAKTSTASLKAGSGIAAQKDYALKVYQNKFKDMMTSKIGSLLLSQAEGSTRMSTALIISGIDDPKVTLSTMLKGKELTKENAPKVLQMLASFKGSNVRISQWFRSNDILASTGVDSTLVNARLARFVQILSNEANRTLTRETLTDKAIGIATHLTGF